MTAPLISKSEKNTSVFYNVQIDELFVKPLVIGFDYYYNNITKDAKIFQKISENYKDMFVISKIEN